MCLFARRPALQFAKDCEIPDNKSKECKVKDIDRTFIACNYEESKIRVGSMVYVKDSSPECCCPPKFNKEKKTGIFFCPKNLLEDTDGPYAQLVHRQITKESNEINADAAPAGACLYRYIPAWYHIWSSTCALILRSCIGEYQSCMDAMFISEEFMNARSQ